MEKIYDAFQYRSKYTQCALYVISVQELDGETQPLDDNTYKFKLDRTRNKEIPFYPFFFFYAICSIYVLHLIEHALYTRRHNRR